ncbi:MAG TPA: hypothetical protein VND93_31150 [Myxococcales bacterium]|nr:hypothetical protein [Myxococcales bacterium]
MVVVASILAACGGDPAVDSRSAPLLGASEPMGTFERSGAAPGEMARVVLMTDGSSHLELATECGEPPCPPQVMDGWYKSSDVEGVEGLEHFDFIDIKNEVVHACDYQYDGKALQALHLGEAQWEELLPASTAWCADASQCEQQWLMTPLCTGQWACVNNGCQFQCSRKKLW